MFKYFLESLSNLLSNGSGITSISFRSQPQSLIYYKVLFSPRCCVTLFWPNRSCIKPCPIRMCPRVGIRSQHPYGHSHTFLYPLTSAKNTRVFVGCKFSFCYFLVGARADPAARLPCCRTFQLCPAARASLLRVRRRHTLVLRALHPCTPPSTRLVSQVRAPPLILLVLPLPSTMCSAPPPPCAVDFNRHGESPPTISPKTDSLCRPLSFPPLLALSRALNRRQFRQQQGRAWQPWRRSRICRLVLGEFSNFYLFHVSCEICRKPPSRLDLYNPAPPVVFSDLTLKFS
jgi:hypothetical protein